MVTFNFFVSLNVPDYTSLSFYENNALYKYINMLFIQTQTSAAARTFIQEKGMLLFYFILTRLKHELGQPIIIFVQYIL